MRLRTRRRINREPRMRPCVKVILTALLAFPGFAPGAPILQTSGGELTGAQGVLVNGVGYNVEFLDGTCTAVFGVCSPANFAFSTLADANAASAALLEQVFVDGTSGDFDSDPSLTSGCTVSLCVAITPYDFLAVSNEIHASLLLNQQADTDDELFGFGVVPNVDLTAREQSVWARWSRSDGVSVPSPGTASLVVLGGAVAGSIRRRRRT